MREDLRKLKEIKNEMIGCELQLAMLEQDLYFINHDYQVLKDLERDLIYNIEFLKKEDVVAVASEFKKSKRELKFVRNKLRVLDIKYKENLKEMSEIQTMLVELRAEYLSQLDFCSNYQSVIPFDLDRRKKNEK